MPSKTYDGKWLHLCDSTSEKIKSVSASWPDLTHFPHSSLELCLLPWSEECGFMWIKNRQIGNKLYMRGQSGQRCSISFKAKLPSAYSIYIFYFSQKKTDTPLCIWHAFVLLFVGISDERDKGAKAHMSRQPLILNKANLRQKTWLGMPSALTVGMFVWGDNTMKIVWSDNWRGCSPRNIWVVCTQAFIRWNICSPFAVNKWKL